MSWSSKIQPYAILVRYYTREAGVRSLEREIANLTRKSVKQLEMGEAEAVVINADNLSDFAGIKKFRLRRS